MLSIHELARRRSAVTRALTVVAALLVMIHIGWQLLAYWTGHDYVFGLIKLFHLNEERNVPALFSALLLLTAAALLGYITRHEKQRGARDVAKWTVLAIGFLYMAVDEFGEIHELLIVPGRELFGDRSFGLFYYAWVIPATAIVLVLAGYFLGFLLRLPARTRLGFIIGGMLFVGGAIGFELLGGRHHELYGKQNLTYMVYVIVEESLEMVGVIVFIHALLHHIDQYFAVVPDGGQHAHARARGGGCAAGAGCEPRNPDPAAAYCSNLQRQGSDAGITIRLEPTLRANRRG